MAEQVLLTIVVDDKGTPAIKQFSQTAQQAFGNVQNSGNNALNNLIKNMNALSSSFLNAAKVSLTFRAVNEAFSAASQLLGTAVTDVLDFDRALREVASIAPEVRKNFAQWRQEIINVNPALGTTTEVAKGLYETFSSGVASGHSAAEALKFTADAAILAKAGLTDNATAVKVLSSGLNAYSAGLNEAGKYSDILFKAVELGQLRFEELAHSIGPVLPIAKSLGIGIGDVSAAIATLTQAGYNASNAATGVKTALVDLISNSAAFRAVGIDVNSVLSQQGLTGLLNELARVTGLNSEKLRLLIPDTRGLAAVMSLLSQDQEKVKNNFNEINNASGNTKIAFDEIKKSGREALANLNAEFDRFVQFLVGQSGIDTFKTTIDTISEAFRALRTDVVAFGVAGAALSTLQLVFGAIELAVGGLVTGTAMLGGSIGIVMQYIPGLKDVGKDLESAADQVFLFGKEITDSAKNNLQTFDRLAERIKNFGKEVEDAGEKEAVSPKQLTALAELRKAAINGASSLLQLDEGMVQSGKSSTSAAASNKIHSDSLDVLARTALLTNGSLDQMIAGFLKAAEESATFEGRLNTVTEGIKAAGKEADEITHGGFTQLVDEYTKLTVEALNLDRALQSNKANLSPTQVQQYEAALAEMEVKLKSTRDTLREYGVDTATLQTRIAAVVQSHRDLNGEALSLDNAFKLLSGGSLKDFEKQTALAIQSIQVMKKEGRLGRDFLIDKVDEAIEKFTELGLEAPEALSTIREELQKMPGEMLNVNQAAQRLKVTLDTDLKNALLDDTKAFDTLKNSGQSNAVALGKSAQQIIDAYTDAGIKIPPPVLAGLDKIARKGREVGEELNKTLEQKLREIGIVMAEEVARKAEQTFQTVNEAVASGERSFGKLAEAMGQAIADIIASGERVPPAYKTLYERLVGYNRDAITDMVSEAEKLPTQYDDSYDKLVKGAVRAGDGIRTGIVSGVHTAVAESVTALQKLNAQIDGLVIQQKFATDIQGILGQLNQAQTELANAKDVPGAIGYANYVKEQSKKTIDYLKENLRDAFLQGIDDAKALAEATGQVQIPQSLLAAASELGITFDKIRKDIEAAAQGANSSSRLTESTPTVVESKPISSAQAPVNPSLVSVAQPKPTPPGGVTPAGPVDKSGTNTLGKYSDPLQKQYEIALANQKQVPIIDQFGRVIGYRSGAPSTLGTAISSGPVSSGGGGRTTPTYDPQRSRNTGAHGAEAASTGQGSLPGASLPKFANGTLYANAGQNVQLEAGEAVLPRGEAEAYRSRMFLGAGGSDTGLHHYVSYSSGSWDYSSSSQALSGFTFVPGMGYIAAPAIAAAAGRLNEHMGSTAQRDLQKLVVPMVRSAIERRDLTRPISQATSLTRKGSPRIGGS